jgi:hypothetical protein
VEPRVGEMKLDEVVVAQVEAALEVEDIGLDAPVEADAAHAVRQDAHVAEVVGMRSSGQGGAVIGEDEAREAPLARAHGELVDRGIGVARGHRVRVGIYRRFSCTPMFAREAGLCQGGAPRPTLHPWLQLID